MKHGVKITIILLAIFLLAQFIGIAALHQSIDTEKTLETGKTTFEELPFGERPPIEEDTSYLPIVLAILIGTGLLFLIIKFNAIWLWKGWFLIAVLISLFVAFGAFIRMEIALLLALILAIWKVFKPNVWVQNFTELFIYGGLAIIFVPIFNLLSVSILLVIISAYDAYAVWKSKHMIKLAKSQAKANMFAGLLIPYKLGKAKKSKIKKATNKKIKAKVKKIPQKVRTALLGGGDIGFPLIFAGVILKEIGLWQALLIPFFALLGLGLLMFIGKEKRFYPAMPFISAGCFLGLLVVWLIGMLI